MSKKFDETLFQGLGELLEFQGTLRNTVGTSFVATCYVKTNKNFGESQTSVVKERYSELVTMLKEIYKLVKSQKNNSITSKNGRFRLYWDGSGLCAVSIEVPDKGIISVSDEATISITPKCVEDRVTDQLVKEEGIYLLNELYSGKGELLHFVCKTWKKLERSNEGGTKEFNNLSEIESLNLITCEDYFRRCYLNTGKTLGEVRKLLQKEGYSTKEIAEVVFMVLENVIWEE